MYEYWPRKKKTWKKKLAVFLLVVIALFSGIIIGNLLGTRTTIVYNVSKPLESEQGNFPPAYPQSMIYEGLLDVNESSFAVIKIPAVDKEDNGVITILTVQALPGSGRILTNIDKLLFWVDTQNSIRRATQVAENVTGTNLTKYDIIYAIQANASVIGGPSAGAAITIATIAALENKSINQSVMITGSVNHDGSIGPVGSIFEKAVASKEYGAQLILVPLTQSTEVTYKTRQYCEKIGWMDFCTTETYPVKLDIEHDADINVLEVMSVQKAMEYMIINK